VCGHNFNAGELGPGTIVGSAAFNMLVIIGLCVSVIPDGKSRKIKHLRVFFITAFWSIFAYIWLYLILAVISPGIVEGIYFCFWDADSCIPKGPTGSKPQVIKMVEQYWAGVEIITIIG
ncbi:Sodium/calcium exchanger 2, partial [Xenoophorus captivus]